MYRIVFASFVVCVVLLDVVGGGRGAMPSIARPIRVEVSM